MNRKNPQTYIIITANGKYICRGITKTVKHYRFFIMIQSQSIITFSIQFGFVSIWMNAKIKNATNFHATNNQNVGQHLSKIKIDECNGEFPNRFFFSSSNLNFKYLARLIGSTVRYCKWITKPARIHLQQHIHKRVHRYYHEKYSVINFWPWITNAYNQPQIEHLSMNRFVLLCSLKCKHIRSLWRLMFRKLDCCHFLVVLK